MYDKDECGGVLLKDSNDEVGTITQRQKTSTTKQGLLPYAA